MAVQIDLAKGLDKAWEDKSLADILAAPPSALAGVSEADDEALRSALGIRTVRDLGTNKYVRLAVALAQLGEHEG